MERVGECAKTERSRTLPWADILRFRGGARVFYYLFQNRKLYDTQHTHTYVRTHTYKHIHTHTHVRTNTHGHIHTHHYMAGLSTTPHPFHFSSSLRRMSMQFCASSGKKS